MSKKILILGGGSAGLAAAWNLIQAGGRVELIELSDSVGGFSKTFTWNGIKLDYGPHSFHVKEDRLTSLFKTLCSDNCVEVPSVIIAQLFVMNRFLTYPLKLREAIFKLNPLFVTRMLSDYLLANLKRLFFQLKEDSFEAWGVKRFGRCLYDLAFGCYSEKVWGMPTKYLSHKLAQQKLPDINIIDVLIEMLGGKGSRQKQFYSAYLYPREGIGQIFEKIAGEIQRTGSKLHTNSSAVRLELKDHKISSASFKNHKNQEVSHIECEAVICSIPLQDLVSILYPLPPESILSQSQEFKYRSLILVYLMLEKERMTDKLMFYLIDKKFKFHRVSELKNLQTGLIPENRSVLCLEICCSEGDEVWKAQDRELYELALSDLKKLNLVDQKYISSYYIKRLKNAYPIFNFDYDRRLYAVLSFLNSIENLYCIGRQGLFLNNDIHDSMEMGLLASDCLIEDGINIRWNNLQRKYLNAGFQGKR